MEINGLWNVCFLLKIMKREKILFIVYALIFVAFLFKKDYKIITLNNPSITISSNQTTEKKVDFDINDLTYINSSIANYGVYTRYCFDIEKKKSSDDFVYIIDIEDNNGIKKYCYLVGEKNSFLYIYPTINDSYKYHIFKIAYNELYLLVNELVQ